MEKKGLYHKYDVTKANTEEQLEDVFVLRFKDPCVKYALLAYAEATPDKQLQVDLLEIVNKWY